jgi:hypothetical protein
MNEGEIVYWYGKNPRSNDEVLGSSEGVLFLFSSKELMLKLIKGTIFEDVEIIARSKKELSEEFGENKLVIIDPDDEALIKDAIPITDLQTMNM